MSLAATCHDKCDDVKTLLTCFCFLLQMQEVQQSKEMTLANNRTLAEQNLALQPRLEDKKEQLIKSYSCLQEIFESYQLRKSSLGMIAVVYLSDFHF